MNAKARTLRCTSGTCPLRHTCLTHLLKHTKWTVAVPLDPVLCKYYRKADVEQSLAYQSPPKLQSGNSA